MQVLQHPHGQSREHSKPGHPKRPFFCNPKIAPTLYALKAFPHPQQGPRRAALAAIAAGVAPGVGRRFDIQILLGNAVSGLGSYAPSRAGIAQVFTTNSSRGQNILTMIIWIIGYEASYQLA